MKNLTKSFLIPILRKIGKVISFFVDLLLLLPILISGLILFFYRWVGSKRFPLNTLLLKKIGIFPIRDHYYEPLFNDKHLIKNKLKERNLPGINFHLSKQLDLLEKLNFQTDFSNFIEKQKNKREFRSFSISNGSYGPGDAEFLYNFLRHLKPSRVIEIGSGNSTLIIKAALEQNKNHGYKSKHTCIEPYKNWLDSEMNIELVKRKLEETNIDWSSELGKGDFLFIDSSHIIRPQGDVLYEYQNIIPILNSGVIVHVHDIFSPRDYPESWITTDVRFWNEQYLLETLLSNSKRYEIIASINYLKHSHFEPLKKVCTFLDKEDEPGSFYFEILEEK